MKNIKTYEEYKGQTFKEFLKKIKYYKYTEDHISCSNEILIDLDGIEVFVNLLDINIDYNKITSLKPLENLTKLNWISFDHNEIISLKSLKKFNLKSIYCKYNYITSLDGIENSFNLKDLDCSDNKITSLKGIENLTKLTNLWALNNPIDWVDYIDKQGRTYYTKLPKSIIYLNSDKFNTIRDYWEFYDQNQPSGISRKFNF